MTKYLDDLEDCRRDNEVGLDLLEILPIKFSVKGSLTSIALQMDDRPFQ